MKKEIKDKWVKALRSGDYKQTRYQLRTTEGYCCLGVLCDLYIKETNKASWNKFTTNIYEFAGPEGEFEKLQVPYSVMKWAGIDSRDPLINTVPASLFNDDCRLTFEEIADKVEKHLE